jgi:hypothetical protein
MTVAVLHVAGCMAQQQQLQVALTFCRVRLDTRLRKFWLISARSARGSDAAATLLAAWRPASFSSHTCRIVRAGESEPARGDLTT